MTEKERIRQTVADLIYARLGWTDAAEGASVDVTSFILADRRRVLEDLYDEATDSIKMPSQRITNIIAKLAELKEGK